MKNLIQMPVKILIPLYFGIAIMLSGNAFADIKDQLQAEIAARQAADATEATVRQSADTAETTARQAADVALQNLIATLQNQVAALQSQIPPVRHIGDVLSDGSIVFWVDETGRHGLAAKPSDAANALGEQKLDWYNANVIAEHYGVGWYSGPRF